eukprot:TRINITY_DN4822_c0_g1_i10.p1 TRINITY_DN4822_c0_g1~~TRINITY_DN4822_c0_g1_i10.p1  ORF type:complete len:267 (-),score=22.66 TRINITY_DN4822_c0_g1_i10:513-1313(-)
MLDINDDSIRKEITIILINLAACESNCVELIRSVNGHKKLIELVDFSDLTLVEQCLWALGNMAGDSAALKEVLLSTDLPQKLSTLLAKEIPLSLRRMACWVISHLCHSTTHVGKAQVLLKPLNSCLRQTDSQVLSETLWALSKIIQDKFTRAETAKQINVAKVLELMGSEITDISIPASYIVGCMCAGDCTCTSLVVENGGIKALCALFKSPSIDIFISKYTCWAIANLSLGSASHLNLLLDYGVTQKAAELVMSSPEYAVFLLMS